MLIHRLIVCPVKGSIQTTDAYLWSAAVSMSDTGTETWWEIRLLFCASNWNKSASGVYFSSLSAEMMHQGKQPVVISVHLSAAPQHAAWERRTLPELQSSTDPLHRHPVLRRSFPALRCPTAAWLREEEPPCSRRSTEEKRRYFSSDSQRRKGRCVRKRGGAGGGRWWWWWWDWKGRRKGVVVKRRRYWFCKCMTILIKIKMMF